MSEDNRIRELEARVDEVERRDLANYLRAEKAEALNAKLLTALRHEHAKHFHPIGHGQQDPTSYCDLCRAIAEAEAMKDTGRCWRIGGCLCETEGRPTQGCVNRTREAESYMTKEATE